MAVLRRAKSGTNASTEERDALLEDAERIENCSVIVIIGAIVVEAIIVFASTEPITFKIVESLANAAVAFGIWIELKFGGVIASILRARIADAEREAAEARLEAEKLRSLTAWRRLDLETFKRLRDAISEIPPASIQFWVWIADPESRTFVGDIANVFRNKGWKARTQYATFLDDVAFGIRFRDVYPGEAEAKLAEQVYLALAAAGIGSLPGGVPRIQMSTASDELLTDPVLDIYVGPKPPIAFD